MTIDALFYAQPAEWDALVVITGTPPDAVVTTTLSKDAERAVRGARTGFWDTFTGGYQVYNAHGSREALDEIDAALVDSFKYIWDSRTGVDAWNLDGTFNTVPADILAVMKDFITYDVNGVPTGTTPATYAIPNFGHKFAGQEDRIFAGQHDDTHDEKHL